MKFAEKYPDAQYGDEVSPNVFRLTSLVSPSTSPCFICKEPTDFYEVNYDCALCSEECLAKMDKGYMEVSAKR